MSQKHTSAAASNKMVNIYRFLLDKRFDHDAHHERQGDHHQPDGQYGYGILDILLVHAIDFPNGMPFLEGMAEYAV